MARRKAMSLGKGGLPPAQERVRSGFRVAAMSKDAGSASPAPAVSAPVASSASATTAAKVPTMSFDSGREASMARRKAMSKGKAGLPPANERVRSGFRVAAMSKDAPAVAASAPAAAAPVATPAPAAPAPVAAPAPKTAAQSFSSGRDASIARRKAMSKGKAGLPPAQERVRSGFRVAAMSKDAPVAAAPAPVAAPAVSAPTATASLCEAEKSRAAAQQYRMIRAQYGRGSKPAAQPVRAQRQGELKYPPKVPSITTAVSNASVTGLSYATGRAMTGAEAGYDKPLTGTQYVAGGEGGYRASLGKVGHQRTEGGQTVSGTMVRSTIRITGDEDSGDVRISGNADQTFADDMNARGDNFIPVGAQFQRQSQPHGHSVHGANLGRSASSIGSRSRDTERPVEQTDGGHSVSGTAIGRSSRVTGDEQGSLRSLTGSQYLAPAGAQATGTPASGRADPASGGKVVQSMTWTGQTITGPQMEVDGVVTGVEHGSCAGLTGTPYFGASAAHGYCEPDAADAQGAARAPKTPRAVTGNVPLNDPNVSGTNRGADRDITGSSYFVAAEEGGYNPEADMVAQSINGFSVSSPQRSSHLQSRTDASASGITGTFAQGDGKITGNVEFAGTLRGRNSGTPAARSGVTGEGSVKGTTITGSAWSEARNVTGTEDYIANSRNPSQQGNGSAQGFAGTARFKSQAPMREQKSSVTGAVGWTPKSGAAVTLSGGAAG